ncbi:hypothetical protein F4805DRAFT_458866 [Annulohypoxylon moriforme]|nr:hypothetical protein F4805DRAFT_458866 [Annulohypoxylon moriforme]
MYTIKPSIGKGLGVFATQKIKRDEMIIHERALFSQTEREDPENGFSWECLKEGFDNLNDSEKSQYLSLSHRHLGLDTKTYDAIRDSLSMGPRMSDDDFQKNFQEMVHIVDVFNTNCARMHYSRYEYGIFPIYSRINHSCIPNARWAYNNQTGEMEVFAARDIADNEEVTISYLFQWESLHTFDNRDVHFLLRGFRCDCEVCLEPKPDRDVRDKRRLRMLELTVFLDKYHGRIWFDDEDPNDIAPGMSEALRLAFELAELYEAEGLLGFDRGIVYSQIANFYDLLGQQDEMEMFERKANMYFPLFD